MRKLLYRDNLEVMLKYGVAALILAIPIYPKFPFIRVPGTYVSIRLEDFLIAIVSLVCLAIVLPRWREQLGDKINRAILIFLGIGLLSVVSGILVTQTVVPHIGILHVARRLEYIMAFFAGMVAIRTDRKNLYFFVKCLGIVMVVIFAVGLLQRYLSFPVITTQNYEYSKGIALRYMEGAHLISTFAGHYDLASFLILVMPIGFTLLFNTKALGEIFDDRGRKKMQIFLLVLIGMGYWMMINAASRISMASFLVSTSLSLFLIRKYRAIPVVAIFSILLIGISGNLLMRYGQIFEVTFKRLIGQAGGVVYAQELVPTPTPAPPAPAFEDRSTSIRLNVEWPRAIRAFEKNPLLGTGFSSITLATDNDYLRLLGEAGILGFFAFILIFWRIGMLFVKRLPFAPGTVGFNESYLAGVFGAVPGVFLNALFIDVFEASKFMIMFWLLLGFAVGLLYEKSKEVRG